MKYWQYSQEELISQKLYLLLPLQVFTLRHKMEKIRKKGVNKKYQKEMILQAKVVVSQIGQNHLSPLTGLLRVIPIEVKSIENVVCNIFLFHLAELSKSEIKPCSEL